MWVNRMLAQKIALVLCGLSLSACSYQPLYKASSSANSELRAVSVAEQNTRTGQLIRNEVLASMGNGYSESESRYQLRFKPESDDINTATTDDSENTRKSYQLSVRYVLSENSSGKVIHKGNTFAHVSYDNTRAPFSDYQAQINAEERAAKEVGIDIRTRLAAFFATRQ